MATAHLFNEILLGQDADKNREGLAGGGRDHPPKDPEYDQKSDQSPSPVSQCHPFLLRLAFKDPDFSVLARFAKTARHQSPPTPLPPSLSDPKVECNPIAFFEDRRYEICQTIIAGPLKGAASGPTAPTGLGRHMGNRMPPFSGVFFYQRPVFGENRIVPPWRVLESRFEEGIVDREDRHRLDHPPQRNPGSP
jgi:hypothetical protein